MDANRYFDAMHNAMSAQHPGAQLLQLQAGIVAAGVLQTDGEQQLCTGVQGGHGVVHGVKITGSVHD